MRRIFFIQIALVLFQLGISSAAHASICLIRKYAGSGQGATSTYYYLTVYALLIWFFILLLMKLKTKILTSNGTSKDFGKVFREAIFSKPILGIYAANIILAAIFVYLKSCAKHQMVECCDFKQCDGFSCYQFVKTLGSGSVFYIWVLQPFLIFLSIFLIDKKSINPSLSFKKVKIATYTINALYAVLLSSFLGGLVILIRHS